METSEFLQDANTTTAIFDEDGERKLMEINDGGRAAAELKSDGEISESESSGSEDEGTERSDNEDCDEDNESDKEQGSVYQSTEHSMDEISEDEPEEWWSRSRSRSKKSKRCSLENKIDSLQTSMKAMEQLLLQQDMVEKQNPRREITPSTSKGRVHKGKDHEDNQQLVESESELTIYHNALQKVNNTKSKQMGNIEVVDAEISFKRRKQHDSSSSEEQINTSDELIEVDINEQFIADCAAEAERQHQ